eukprot:TRINITY_DN3346_c0_g1_i1.p1 TRINITY_DN3346_c0_g1~~TRINITY_DN3346_c0_g1_i1.p1  ORF type:complete len:448 (-),score=100.05 TRINITY_DN3346_c0_g1_i1:50-1393(-)
MFSQFFVLNPKGDTIILRDYRGDLTKSTPEIFFRHISHSKADPAPIFTIDGINYMTLRTRGLYLTLTSGGVNISPNFALELLARIAKLIKDYCGVLSESSIRDNFVLVYELMDEILDNGYPQTTSTDQLKAFIHHTPAPVDDSSPSSLSIIESAITGPRKTTSSKSAMRPVQAYAHRVSGISSSGDNELFVDLVEQLTVVFGPTGNVLRSEIDGAIVIKSYLAGNPEVRLALNEDLVLSSSLAARLGTLILDDFNFHECVGTQLFDEDRTLIFSPPEGEFTLMNYRISSEFQHPFRIVPYIEEVGPSRLDFIIKLRSSFPEEHFGNNVVLKIPLPKSTASCSSEMEVGVTGQATEYNATESVVFWNIKKFKGETEYILRLKIILPSDVPVKTAKKEIGPISMEFDIPMYNCSNVQIRFLRVMERNKSYQPHRWIRYITLSKSYTYRL